MTKTTEYTKHTTSTDALETLGFLISADEGRDAIHLAVDPTEAGESLLPGEHVFLAKGVARRADGPDQGVGIVDPFLTQVVPKGGWFWLVVYPRQITSLRHVWEHPSFPSSTEAEKRPDNSKALAEKWIRAWIPTVDLPFTFEEVIEALTTGSGGSYPQLHYSDGELWSGGVDAYGSIPNDFWDMAEIYTGLKFTQRSDYFSCSC